GRCAALPWSAGAKLAREPRPDFSDRQRQGYCGRARLSSSLSWGGSRLPTAGRLSRRFGFFGVARVRARATINYDKASRGVNGSASPAEMLIDLLLDRRIDGGQLLLPPTDMRPYGPLRESAVRVRPSGNRRSAAGSAGRSCSPAGGGAGRAG